MRIAVVDLGSNSFRMLIADCNEGRREIIRRELETTRLGEGVDENGVIAPAAMKRAEKVLAGFAETIVTYNVDKVIAAGTSALRDVNNPEGVVKLVQDKLNTELAILSGRQEAFLVYRGVSGEFSDEDILLFDVGGGSTEIICENYFLSLDLGAVRMMERCLENPSSELKENDLLTLRRVTQEIFNQYLSLGTESERMVGVGGTVTTLAAIAIGLDQYISSRIHKYKLKTEVINQIIDRLAVIKFDERKGIPGLPAERADIIVPGAVIVSEIMNIFEYKSFTVSDRGLLFGLLEEAVVE